MVSKDFDFSITLWILTESKDILSYTFEEGLDSILTGDEGTSTCLLTSLYSFLPAYGLTTEDVKDIDSSFLGEFSIFYELDSEF